MINMEQGYKRKKKRRRKIGKIAALSVVALLLISAIVVFGLFRIQEVEVVGNDYYTADEIKKMVMSDSMAQNSIYLTRKYSHANIQEELPFLSAVEIEMLSPYKVRIQVYEKTIVGYIQTAGSNVYFDKDGVVMENSQEVREGVPMISGVTLGKVEVLGKLPIEDKELFKSVVTLAQLLNKNEILPDEIHFDEENAMSLYFEKNTVLLGQNKNLEDKISNLKAIYPKMSSMEGTLDLENFTSDSSTAIFKKGNGKKDGGDKEEGESESESESETGKSAGSSYKGGSGKVSKDAAGNEVYTDDAGNVTSDMTQQYLGDDGQVITDGYGYIDPYTGAYILN